jgi:hypothetical protein
MIAVDTLVHNFLHRTGILQRGWGFLRPEGQGVPFALMIEVMYHLSFPTRLLPGRDGRASGCAGIGHDRHLWKSKSR